MQISFTALSCSNLAALSCSNLAAPNCSNLVALSCSNLAALSCSNLAALCVERVCRPSCRLFLKGGVWTYNNKLKKKQCREKLCVTHTCYACLI